MATTARSNPILDFGIDRNRLNYLGCGLQRPECILAEPDGALWVADARGGVVRLGAGRQPENRHAENLQPVPGGVERRVADFCKARCPTASRSIETAICSLRISAPIASS